jgi:hypothetical protein
MSMRFLWLLYCAGSLFYTSIQPITTGESRVEKQQRLSEALVKAIAAENPAGVDAAIQEGADVNVIVLPGYAEVDVPPLLYAIKKIQFDQDNLLEIIRALLDHGSDVNAQTKKNGETALMLALLNGKEKVVHELLRRGATVNVQNKRNQTALDYLEMGRSKFEEKQYQALRQLLQKKYLITQSRYAKQYELLDNAIANNEKRIVKQILDVMAQLGKAPAYAKDPATATIPDPWGRKSSNETLLQLTMRDLQEMLEEKRKDIMVEHPYKMEHGTRKIVSLASLYKAQDELWKQIQKEAAKNAKKRGQVRGAQL